MKDTVDLANVLTPQEAATPLAMNARGVIRLAKQKRIAAIKVGRYWVIYKPSLTWYLNRKVKQ